MAYDKVVDSAQLDAIFTAIADAVRSSLGTTATISHQNLADEVLAIPDETISTFFTGGQTTFSNSKTWYIRKHAFHDDTDITTVSFPNVKNVGEYAFSGATNLSSVSLPNAQSIMYKAFEGCTNLTELDLPAKTGFIGHAFLNSGLQKLILRSTEGVSSAGNDNFLEGTPIANGTGYIYVPDVLVDDYKANSMFQPYVNQIKPISELDE